MATITVDIPEVKDINLVELQEKVSRYAHRLVMEFNRQGKSAASTTEQRSELSSIYGIINLPEDSYDTLRAKAFHEKYGI